MLPVEFVFDGWQDPLRHVHTLAVEPALTSLQKLVGLVPAELTTEDQVRAFAGVALIPLADADVEPDLFFPHRYYASRGWVKQMYREFMTWCHKTGWLVTPTVPPVDIPETASSASEVPVAVGETAAGPEDVKPDAPVIKKGKKPKEPAAV